MSIRVSVVIPTYNRADLLGETLDSVLGQVHPAAEIIVVDDGSFDHTERVVRARRGPIRYEWIENGGVCRARNHGVGLADTEWVAFCDSDDLWDPLHLAALVSFAHREPAIPYFFTNFRHVVDGAWTGYEKFSDAPPGYWAGTRAVSESTFVVETPLYDRVLRWQPIFPSTVLITKAFFERVGGFDDSFGRTASEDLEFTLRCVQEAPVGVSARPTVGIRKHAGNNSGDIAALRMGEIAILHHASTHHRVGRQHVDLIATELRRRRREAFEHAFASANFSLAREVSRSVWQENRSVKVAVKVGIAHLPSVLARGGRYLMQNVVGRLRRR
jgi:glycosyltransferase involved in cell wall biosynthesis